MNDVIRKTYSILLVDDSPLNLKILGEALKSQYRIRLATNGQKALEIANSSSPPDLILLDIMMPDIDGYEVCRQLKAKQKSQNIPVIFITAMGEEKDETRGLEIGAVDYITKPFSLPILKARVKTHLELKRHRDILENLSALDGLTGIPNRRRFDEVLLLEWSKALESSQNLSLIMLDIDHFKLFNDNLGHVAGDHCLKHVAAALEKMTCRPHDLVARYGGEEFCIILPDTRADGALIVANRIFHQFESLEIPHAISPVSKYVTCSIGVATIIPDDKSNIELLLNTADKCLYRAKEHGRNCVKSIDLNE